jgi:4a-hydroxytetrahydrobiopterin dehydratase
MTRVTLYTRHNCHLCDEAKEAIRSSGVEVEMREIDIDTDRDLVWRYGTHVPVIFVDGEEAFRHRVSASEFADYVRSPRATRSLANEKCVPCRGGVPALKGEELRALEAELGAGWRVVDDHHLEKEYKFRDFAQALAFTNEVGAIAEEEQHHPDIHLAWGKVGITIWTHAIDGLTRSDFVLAAKIDARHLR